LPRIAVLTLGGTIAMVPDSEGQGGLRPALSGEDLLASIEGVGSIAELRVSEIMNRPSPHLTFADLYHLVELIESAIAGGADGVVVVQGTDTIEVTAFVLDLLIRTDAPIVVTGAMRGASAPGAEGSANLSAAIRSAASRDCCGCGVLVVMNDEIHAARHVSKGHSSNPAAFVSDPGPVGRLVEGRPLMLLRPQPVEAATLAAGGPGRDRRICVVHLPAEIDDDGALVRAALDIGCDGMVVSGMGGGHIAPAMVPAVAKAAAQLPVILVTKCPRGGVLSETYGYAGAEIDLAARGVVRAGYLNPSKARAALVLLLGSGRSLPEIRTFFAAFGGG